MSLTEKDFADLWAKQSDLFWKLVLGIPLVEIAVVAGWYPVMKDSHKILALSIGILGLLVMTLGGFLTYRAGQYLAYFGSKAPTALRDVPDNLLKGRTIGVLTPMLCVVMNIFLILYTLSIN